MTIINLSYNDRKNHTLSEYSKFEEFLNELSREIDPNLKETAKKIEKSVFNLVVLGEAKSGKSTFINSYLGTEILPMSSLQCTSSIIEIKRGPNWELKAYDAKDNCTIINTENEIKDFLQTHAAINKDYNSIPVSTINDNLIKVKGNFIKDQLPDLIRKLEKENFHSLPIEEYNKKIEKYIEAKKDTWDKIIKKLEISCPLVKDELGEISLIDSPGVGANGNVGIITEEYIKKADAIIFVKSLLGQSLESTSFMNFVDNNITDKSRENLFLIFTGKAIKNKKEFTELEEEAKKIYKQRIDENKILFIDSLIELYLNKCKDIATSEEIDEYFNELDEKGELDSIVDKIWYKKSNKDKELFIENMKKESGFNQVDITLENYAKTAKYNQLHTFLNNIYESYEKIRINTNEQLNTLSNSDNRSIEEIKHDLSKKEEKLEEFNNNINKDIKEINNDFQGTFTGGKSIINEKIKYLKENELKKFKNKLNNIEKQISKNDNPDSILNKIKTITKNSLDEVDDVRNKLQNLIVEECNKKINSIEEQSQIKITSNLTEIDYDKIKAEAINQATKEIEEGLTFKKVSNKFIIKDYVKKVKDSILNRLDSEIIPNLENSIRDYLNKTLEFYKDKLEKSIEQEKQAISKLNSEFTDVESLEKQITLIKNQLEKLNILKKEIKNLLKEVENYVR